MNTTATVRPFESEKAAVKAMAKAEADCVTAFCACLQKVTETSGVTQAAYDAGSQKLMTECQEHAKAVYAQATAQGFKVECANVYKTV